MTYRLIDARLNNSRLDFTDLIGTNLTRTQLQRALLAEAVLTDAVFVRTDLQFADLRNAIFDWDSMSEAIVTGTVGLPSDERSDGLDGAAARGSSRNRVS